MIARFVPVVARSHRWWRRVGNGLQEVPGLHILGAAIWVVSLVYGGYLSGNVPIIKDNLASS